MSYDPELSQRFSSESNEFMSYGFEIPRGLKYDWQELTLIKTPTSPGASVHLIPDLQPESMNDCYIGVTEWFNESADLYNFPLTQLQNSFPGAYGRQRWYYFRYSSPYAWQKFITRFCHDTIMSFCDAGRFDAAVLFGASAFGQSIAQETFQILKERKQAAYVEG